MIWDQQPYYRPQQPEHFYYTTTTRTYALPHPSKGETWWVKFSGAKALSEVVVTDITAHTVELEHRGYYGVRRYVRDEVTFIEKVYK